MSDGWALSRATPTRPPSLDLRGRLHDGAQRSKPQAGLRTDRWRADTQFAGRAADHDKYILQVDADGVALAAIKTLNDRVNRLARENAELRREISRLHVSQTKTH